MTSEELVKALDIDENELQILIRFLDSPYCGLTEKNVVASYKEAIKSNESFDVCKYAVDDIVKNLTAKIYKAALKELGDNSITHELYDLLISKTEYLTLIDAIEPGFYNLDFDHLYLIYKMFVKKEFYKNN